METKTEWAHLPNAHIIDAILDSLEKHPKEWAAAKSAAAWEAAMSAAARSAAWEAAAAGVAARVAAWEAAEDVARDAAWEAAVDAAWDAAWEAAAARSALSALIAWDNSVDILRMPLEAITMLAKLNNPAAVLLLPTAQLIHKHPKVLTLDLTIWRP